MAYCPYCGTKIHSEESYCVSCGKPVPDDIVSRNKNKRFNKWWLVPFSAFLLAMVAGGMYYAFLNHQTAKAKESFQEGESLALQGDYEKASDLFQRSLDLAYLFPAAESNKRYVNVAKDVEALIEDATYKLNHNQFQESLNSIDQAEKKLNKMDGELVSKLIEDIVTLRHKTKVSQLQASLKKDSSIDQQKNLLWEAEAIPTEEAKSLATEMKNQIISHAFSKANEELKQKQFSQARGVVEEGLRYAPESEKLQSLKTTIEKEKIAFETAQQNRIEQAMLAAEEEQQKNQNDAVEMVKIEASLNEQDHLVVKGKLKSVATVPINSVSISYNLLDQDENILQSNEVYIYPDTLYPDEIGQFEFTHFEVEKALHVKIDKVKWFID